MASMSSSSDWIDGSVGPLNPYPTPTVESTIGMSNAFAVLARSRTWSSTRSAPVFQSNLTEDIPGYLEAPANALAYSWKHFIGGHMGRLGTRDDLALHQQYMADIADSARVAIDTVDPTPYFVKYGENFWAALKGYLDECAATTAAPVIEKYTGVLAAADVFTEDVAFQVMQSIRLDLGYGAQVHP